jgi:hypothetical protein
LDDTLAEAAMMKKSGAKPTGRNNILEVAVELCRRLDDLEFRYCVIGGVANQRWGEPRQTVNVDATLYLQFGDEQEVVEQLLLIYAARMDAPIPFALQNRIVLLESELGTGIDVSLGGLPFEERLVDRASVWHVEGHGGIRTCSAEDLVVLKAFASRPQDWIDVEKVIIRQVDSLDRNLIRSELHPLAELKEDPEILTQLEQLLEKHPA